ncbi:MULTISPECIES: SDR family oxidoreductase [Novacetimonas]|uniref:Oxidoreductase Lmo0432 n=2 Tax=Novacetimonas hansenii TaxID=436 RepID=A0ABQ0SFI2_NOVHA|nr:SDR family oxidoreductase [Novacetimonas hansenii]EFG84614.1 short-chain dehydrogenase/reductase SDR [Novacetimonas hansenii ATCC 23769]PYD71461.1 NAD(P)-dependent oxidoreductase [Novacetimonas hansenii]RFP05363.1 oxidoreductase [Novacetimonas hansenii]WEQ59807.1 SDR family oxidoreductase [Novacetimonas hansenii]CUW47897.1 putative oxidoreductase [Novacetimonas hansenii]
MIKDKVVVITGASSGIGEATARLLAQQGAKVVLGARREGRLQTIVSAIEAQGGTATYAVTDVTKAADNEALINTAIKKYGHIDVIFLNAGFMPTAPVSALKTDEWNAAVDINIKGVLNGVAAVMPHFLKQKSGQVIAVSSVAGLKAYPGSAIYGGTKWFVRDFMEVLRMESALEGTNIRTSTIYPAAVKTELLGGISDPRSALAMQKLYDQHAIPAERVANVVAFAISAPADTTINEFTVGPTNQAW